MSHQSHWMSEQESQEWQQALREQEALPSDGQEPADSSSKQKKAKPLSASAKNRRLLEAARAGDAIGVKTYLQMGADPNAIARAGFSYGHTAL